MNIIEKRKIWFLVSGTFIALGMIAIFTGGLKPGLDFTGGTIIEVKNVSDKDKVSEGLNNTKISFISVEQIGGDTVRVKTPVLSEEEHKKILSTISVFSVEGQQAEETQYSTVGPTLSKSIVTKAYISIFLGILVVILYVAWSFRKASSHFASWKYGICAALAMFHDVLFVLGFFAVLGHFLGVEIDSLFVTALLTIISFSVHDTIVIFDRIRENLRKGTENLEFVANKSVIEMLSRSINTSIVIIFVILSLLLLGRETIQYFTLTLLVGIISGTYSSTFIASPLLVVWKDWDDKRKLKV